MSGMVHLMLSALRPKLFEMEVVSGKTMLDCKREAALVSVNSGVDVQFTFNDTTYIVGYEQLLDQVKPLAGQ